MIFSADIEDWQQSVLDFKNPISRRVLASTYKLLAILDDHQVSATFFVQGMVTEKNHYSKPFKSVPRSH